MVTAGTHAIHAAADWAVQQLGYPSIKNEQLKIVVGEVREVFAVLPNRYGKSLCYACLPLVFDYAAATEWKRVDCTSYYSTDSDHGRSHNMAQVIVRHDLTFRPRDGSGHV